MPSEYQSGNDEYDNEAERFLSTDMELAPLIRGIESQERILMWWNTANKMGIEGERREQIKARMEHLND